MLPYEEIECLEKNRPSWLLFKEAFICEVMSVKYLIE